MPIAFAPVPVVSPARPRFAASLNSLRPPATNGLPYTLKERRLNLITAPRAASTPQARAIASPTTESTASTQGRKHYNQPFEVRPGLISEETFADAGSLSVYRKPEAGHAAASALLSGAGRIHLVSFSNTGSGHQRWVPAMSRMLDEGRLHAGDAVVLHLPPLWSDGEEANLRVYKDLTALARKLMNAGVNVIPLCGEKAITGRYHPEGASDVRRIREGWALKPLAPRMGIELDFDALALTPRLLSGADGQPDERALERLHRQAQFVSVNANELVGQLIDAAGDAGKIVGISDMGCPTESALLKRGLKSFGISNHGNIVLDADPRDLRNLEYAKIVPPSEQVLVDLAGELNTLPDMRYLLEGKAGAAPLFQPGMAKAQARDQAVRTILAAGRDLSRETDADTLQAGGYLCDPQAASTPGGVKNIVCLYLNKYTKSAVDFIKQAMAQDPAFRSTLFLVCGGGAVKGHNALALGLAGQADVFANAGFGMVTNHTYLANKTDASCNMLALPVQGQTEQEYNARKLEQLYGDRHGASVRAADDGNWKARLQRMVRDGVDKPMQGDMKRFFEAATEQHSLAQYIDDRISGVQPPSRNEVELRRKAESWSRDAEQKSARRIAKMVEQLVLQLRDDTRLQALASQPGTTLELRPVNTRAWRGTLAQAAALLRHPAELARVTGTPVPQQRPWFLDEAIATFDALAARLAHGEVPSTQERNALLQRLCTMLDEVRTGY